ncbi:hypothetical protein BU23DRAFT_466430 [Bimuria novae-zelandiae CBS 107.79]|uniref:C2H2-type domain-containing protein n=1 Tax=Bimuria novae-zelandiae CBS 107.79 TaxID=1447943 RepID=A0A6A5VHW6_9PLEO|nr:hypothetical protein BU23DRAFT_466430 [Bimuria novae-zelandiae CBS 107.79]
MDSPASDLSDYASDDFPDEVKGRRISVEHTPDHEPAARPSKRPRLQTRAPSDPPSNMPPFDDLGELSEDTDGSVPASPHHPGMSAEDDFGQDQVSVCKWDGCDTGDLENMDRLVEHLHEDHIGTRQKKYSCEWSDCNRKGIPHASGYALRAHMRSHTREKPFYCTLPECDRSFTRSDALAKHMRTVHETEALRPSDPVPKHHSSNPSNKFQRVKLVLSEEKRSTEKGSTPGSPSSHAPNSATLPPPSNEPDHLSDNIQYVQNPMTNETEVEFPPDMNFSERELLLPADQLFRLLRRQLHWATQDGEKLRAEAEALEKQRKDEWAAKELLVENVMEAELESGKRRRLEAGETDGPDYLAQLEADVVPSKKLQIQPKAGTIPWWREEGWLRSQYDEGDRADQAGDMPVPTS